MTATNMCYNFVGFGCSPPLYLTEGFSGTDTVSGTYSENAV